MGSRCATGGKKDFEFLAGVFGRGVRAGPLALIAIDHSGMMLEYKERFCLLI